VTTSKLTIRGFPEHRHSALQELTAQDGFKVKAKIRKNLTDRYKAQISCPASTSRLTNAAKKKVTCWTDRGTMHFHRYRLRVEHWLCRGFL